MIKEKICQICKEERNDTKLRKIPVYQYKKSLGRDVYLSSIEVNLCEKHYTEITQLLNSIKKIGKLRLVLDYNKEKPNSED